MSLSFVRGNMLVRNISLEKQPWELSVGSSDAFRAKFVAGKTRALGSRNSVIKKVRRIGTNLV
jgi:hypothetical protein